MLRGYITVAVLIQLGLIPYSEVDLPCLQGLLESCLGHYNGVVMEF